MKLKPITLKIYEDEYYDEENKNNISIFPSDEENNMDKYYPENLKDSIELLTKHLNRNILPQVKVKSLDFNVTEYIKDKKQLLLKSQEIISTQLGIIALVAENVYLQIALNLHDMSNVQGVIHLIIDENRKQLATIKIKNEVLEFKLLKDEDYYIID